SRLETVPCPPFIPLTTEPHAATGPGTGCRKSWQGGTTSSAVLAHQSQRGVAAPRLLHIVVDWRTRPLSDRLTTQRLSLRRGCNPGLAWVRVKRLTGTSGKPCEKGLRDSFFLCPVSGVDPTSGGCRAMGIQDSALLEALQGAKKITTCG